MLKACTWILLLAVAAGCGAGTGLPAGTPGGMPIDPPAYPLVVAPQQDPSLYAFEPFNYDNTNYPQGLHGQEGGFGFVGPWNDADGDVTDRVVGAHALGVGSDMAPLATGGRSIQVNTTGTGIFRALDRTYGTDGSTVWVSFQWIATDTATPENLHVVDFNTATGGFGLLVGQVRGLADDDSSDGMYELADHPARVSADIGARDQAAHFVLMRFSFGVGNADTVDVWWDPASATFDALSPTASVTGVDATFSRITLRSGPSAASLDELYIGASRLAVTQAALRVTSYHVGNSLTWDAYPDGIEALAGQHGYLHDTGHHIRCGQTLENIWKVPNDTCVPPIGEYGTFQPALPNHAWTAVTLQPHRGGTSTLLTDETVILDMIALTQQSLANDQTRFYVYATWPERTNYVASWSQAVVDDDLTPTVQARAYYEHLIKRVRAKTNARVYVIPAGEVLFVLDQKLRAGEVPGFVTISDIYRDDVHLSHNIGRFTAGLTKTTTLYATPPHGIVKPTTYYGTNPAVFTPAVYTAIYDAIWSVVSTHPYAGITNQP